MPETNQGSQDQTQPRVIHKKKLVAVIFIFCLLIIAAYCIDKYVNHNRREMLAPQVSNEENKPATSLGEPVFEWTYSSFEEKEIPRTIIGLVARYPDGTTQTKEIDRIQGGCNEYADPDRDVYVKSKMIICYYAGFGDYYKVVKSQNVYLIKRKTFEEGGPDYTSVQPVFETIAQF